MCFGGTVGQSFQLGVMLCPPEFPLFPSPSWGGPLSFLIYASTGVQCCFGTNTIPQCQGTGFLRICWQRGLGEVGAGCGPWAVLRGSRPFLPPRVAASGWGSLLFLFLLPWDAVTFDFCLINIQPTDTVFKEVLILSGHPTPERQSREEPALQ